MTRAVMFRTPGQIDFRALTIMGLSAKPATGAPIGRFGTGLKYAIAVLVRTGLSPMLWIGNDKFTFTSRAAKFRGAEFQEVWCRREKYSLMRATNIQMPFTTQLGRDWEMWMAFRELESNTRDEGGTTELASSWEDRHDLSDPDSTTIVVPGEDFAQCWLDRDTVFLPDSLAARVDGGRVQVMDRPSKNLFYRGLRAADLDKPTYYTYNFLGALDLTEDRTLKFLFQAQSDLARQVATSDDEALIERLITAEDTHWEHGISWDYQSEVPSDAFHAVMARRRGAALPSVSRYYGVWAPRVSAPATALEQHPRPWSLAGRSLMDGRTRHIGTIEPGTHPNLGQTLVDIMNRDSDE